MGADFMRARIDGEVEALKSAGVQVELVTPDQACRDAFGANLMDGARRADVVRAGLQQGRDEAARLKGFWG